MIIRCRRAEWTVLTTLCVVMAIAGCAGQVDDAKRFGKTGKVAGKLTYAGNAVKEARIQFASRETGAAVLGTVEDGAFTMTDPVPVGEYKVAVLVPEEPPPEAGVAYKPKTYNDIPLKYRDTFNSDLKATVNEGDNEFTFDMKP